MGIKKIIKKSFNKLGFNISRVNKGIDNASFDELLKNKIKEKPVIFDVGGNQGQSIEKYLLPNNFRMVGLDLVSNNLFSNLVFFADVYYFNKKHYNV